MNIELAREVVRTCFRCGRELEDLMHLLKEHCVEAEYVNYARGIATAIYNVHTEVAERALGSYPELKKEIDEKVEKYGRFI
jgi:hypothetical protein